MDQGARSLVFDAWGDMEVAAAGHTADLEPHATVLLRVEGASLERSVPDMRVRAR